MTAATLATMLLAAGASATAVAALVWQMARPRTALATRLRPYTVPARTMLGDRHDLAVAERRERGPLRQALARVHGGLHRLVDHSEDATLALRLRHAGLLTDLPAEQRVAAHRSQQLGHAALGGTLGGALGAVALDGATGALVGAALGLVAGAARARARVDRAITERREQARVELYTINQLLALHARAGGGVAQMLQRVSTRTSGIVAEELADVVASHRGGRPLDRALAQAARTSVEPAAARTYRVLATGAAHGTDLTEALRGLSEDIREQRAEALRRTAARRRAAMLVPTVLLLAPLMLLFVGAPLPSIVFDALS